MEFLYLNLKKCLQQHKDDITKALSSNSPNASFDSALSSRVFDNPSYKEESTLINNDLGTKQVV